MSYYIDPEKLAPKSTPNPTGGFDAITAPAPPPTPAPAPTTGTGSTAPAPTTPPSTPGTSPLSADKLPAPDYGTSSVQDRVAGIASQDSNLNRMAATEGAKALNRRGLLNSTMAVEASQDAVLKNALPIASQDASQAFTGQQNAQQRNLEERTSLANIESTEGIQSAQRALDKQLQDERLAEADKEQVRQIASTEGMAAADRALQQKLQANEIAFNKSEAKLNRDLQTKLVSWNLKSSDRNAAAQFLTNMETEYQTGYQSIMNNTALSAGDRTKQLAAVKKLRDHELNFVEQMYNIDLKW